MNTIEVLNKSQTILKDCLNTFNFDTDKKNLSNLINYICKEFDPSGFFAICYIKYFINTYVKFIKISLLDIIKNCYENDFNKLQELYKILSNTEIISIEINFINILNQLTLTYISSKKTICTEKSDISNILGFLLENFSKLNLDVIQTNNTPIIQFNKISKSIHFFNTTEDCIKVLNSTENGIYLCYILSEKYFGYFIKSNNNLFSINNKNLEYLNKLFPYELINLDKENFSSYIKDFMSEQKKFSFDKFNQQTFNFTVLIIYLLSKKFIGKTLK